MVQQLTVLIIDDNLQDSQKYEGYLRENSQRSYIILSESTGKAGLDLCQNVEVDLILIEYRLPDMDGLEFFCKLKQQQPTPSIIMLTEYGNENIAVQAIKSGFQDYLVKQQVTAKILNSTVESAFLNAPKFAPQLIDKEVEISNLKQIQEELRLSNERFQLASRAVECVIYDWDITFNSVIRTEGITAILGYSLEEIEPTIEWWMELVHPEDKNSLFQPLQLVLANQNYYSFEYRVRHKNGEYRYVLDRGLVVRNAMEHPVRVVGSMSDISETKQIEAALRESETKFKAIIESNIVGIYFGDFTGKIYEANDAFLETFGYTREELEAGLLYWNRMTPGEYSQLDAQRIQELQINGVCKPFEKEYFHKNGTRIPILLAIAPSKVEKHPATVFVLFLISASVNKRKQSYVKVNNAIVFYPKLYRK